MARIFKTPFGAQGDTEQVPEAPQGDGSVSLTQGFGYDYEREYEDPAAKDIRREVMNGLFHDVTEAIGDIQLSGVAKWSADAAPYPAGAVVWHNSVAWQSRVNNNTATPSEGAGWTAVATAASVGNAYVPLTRTITAGTGLSGGGSLAANRTLSVDYGTTAGTAAQGNDSRLSNSREWTADTVSQAEAQAGTATTRRAWTAQRVRQAVAAWWNGISTDWSRGLIGSNNAEGGRSELGLGSAATRSVGESFGNLMEVGAFGLGAGGSSFGVEPGPNGIRDIPRTSAFVHSQSGVPGDAPHASQGAGLKIGGGNTWNATLWTDISSGRLFIKTHDSAGDESGWFEVYTDGHFNVAEYTNNSDTEETNFPVGDIIIARRDQLTNIPPRRGGQTVYKRTSSPDYTIDAGVASGPPLTGLWRNKGRAVPAPEDGSQSFLMQRTA